MENLLAFHFALRTIKTRRIRTLLAVTSITLAVFALVAIQVAGAALVEAQRYTYSGTAQPDIVASVPDLSSGLVTTLSRRPGVAVVEARLIVATRVSAEQRWIPTRLVGIEGFDTMQLDRPRLVAGRWPSSGEVALDLAAERLLGVKLGDTVAFQANPADSIIYARVSGFAWVPARPDATLLNQLTAYMPARDLRLQLHLTGANTLLIKVQEPQLASQIAGELRRFLAARQVTSFGWVVRDSSTFLGWRELQTLLILLRLFAALGTVVSLFIVSHMTLGLLAEEQPTLGTLRAIGATRWQIARLYLVGQLLLGLLGSLAGLFLGVFGGHLLSNYLARLAGLALPTPSLPLQSVTLGFAVGVGVATGGALVPLLLSTQIPPAVLQREPGLRASEPPRWLTRVTGPLARLSPLLVMSLRDPFRRPLRTLITIAVTTVGLAALLASHLVDLSLRRTVADLYNRYQADAWFLTNPPVSPLYAHRLAARVGVQGAEPWMLTQGAIGAVRTDVWGIPRNSLVYQPRLIAGQWLTPSIPEAVVLTGNLSRHLHISPEEVIALDLGKRRIPVRVIGIVNDESTYLGAATLGKVFIDERTLSSLLGQDGRVALYALQFWDRSPKSASSTLARLERDERALRPFTLLMVEDRAATERALAVLTILTRTVVAVIGLAAILGLANALLLDIAERRREYGVLRVLGSELRSLVAFLLGKALVVGGLGGFLAIPLGLTFGNRVLRVISGYLFEIPPYFNWQLVIPIIAAVLIGTLAAVAVPAAVVARLRPIEVLRYE